MSLLPMLKTFMTKLIVSESYDLTYRQLGILLIVYDGEVHSVKTLTENLNIPKATISRAVEKLFELKLVTKEKDPKDRRSVIVGETIQGREFIETINDFLE